MNRPPSRVGQTTLSGLRSDATELLWVTDSITGLREGPIGLVDRRVRVERVEITVSNVQGEPDRSPPIGEDDRLEDVLVAGHSRLAQAEPLGERRERPTDVIEKVLWIHRAIFRFVGKQGMSFASGSGPSIGRPVHRIAPRISVGLEPLVLEIVRAAACHLRVPADVVDVIPAIDLIPQPGLVVRPSAR